MEKTLNLLVYLPGYAGNFIRFLLSLDDKTYPIHHKDTYYDGSISRKKLYSYKNLFWKHSNWENFEQSFISPLQKPLDLFLAQNDYTMTTINLHPGYKKTSLGYFDFFKETYQVYLDKMNINYLQVSLSEHYRPVIFDFMKTVTNNVWRDLYKDEQKDLLENTKFTNTYQPYIINLDSFLKGPDTFVTEYHSLCDYLKLNKNTDDALDLYEEWYSARKFDSLLEKHGLK